MFVSEASHGGTLVCMFLLNRFSKCQCFVLSVLFVAISNNGVLNAFCKLEDVARTKGFLLRRDLLNNKAQKEQ